LHPIPKQYGNAYRELYAYIFTFRNPVGQCHLVRNFNGHANPEHDADLQRDGYTKFYADGDLISQRNYNAFVYTYVFFNRDKNFHYNAHIYSYWYCNSELDFYRNLFADGNSRLDGHNHTDAYIPPARQSVA
jgi:hypothetical protein